MRISDWSSDVCSSDLLRGCALLHQFAHQMGDDLRIGLAVEHAAPRRQFLAQRLEILYDAVVDQRHFLRGVGVGVASRRRAMGGPRSEEHTSELQSLMRISYAVFCLKKKKKTKN